MKSMIHVEGDTATVGRTCRICREWRTVEVPRDGLTAWEQGASIKHAMPTLPAEDQEFLISAICPDCWDELINALIGR